MLELVSSLGFDRIAMPSKDFPPCRPRTSPHDWEDQVEEQIKGRQKMSPDHGARKNNSKEICAGLVVKTI